MKIVHLKTNFKKIVHLVIKLLKRIVHLVTTSLYNLIKIFQGKIYVAWTDQLEYSESTGGD